MSISRKQVLDASVTACSSSTRAERGGVGDPVSRARGRERERESTDAACHCIPHHSYPPPLCISVCASSVIPFHVYTSLSLSLSFPVHHRSSSFTRLHPRYDARIYVRIYAYNTCACVYVCKSTDGSRE